MNKEIYDILYNPSSINTCYENATVEERESAVQHELSTKQSHFLRILDQMALVRDEEFAKAKVLELYRDVLMGVPSELRAFVLNGVNMCLKRFEVRFAHSKNLFDQCLQLVVEIKAQIDREDSLQGMLTPSEWVEVEKSICHLTRWEKNFRSSSEEEGFPLHVLEEVPI